MNPLRVLIATTNPGKQREMEQILAELAPGIVLVLPDSVALADVEETGATFAENAILKARAAADASGLVSIADDGGLEIDAMGGAPGVHSHRFLGADTPFTAKMRAILERLRDTPDADRSARFRCVVAIARPESAEVDLCSGVCEGRIARAPQGDQGFGYDPIFIPDGETRHMAELAPAEKHRLSHRGQAMRVAAERLGALARG